MVSQEFVRCGLSKYIVKNHNNRVTYLVDQSTLKQLDVKRWSRQRPADETRVTELQKFLEKEGDISGVLCLAWHPSEELVIYDGQHRWAALQIIPTFQSKILVEILWNSSEEEIIAAFLAINRCVAVPELYTDTSVSETSIRPEIADFVSTLVNTHKEFVSSTDKPNRPNFNRDRLTTELFELWRDEFHKEVSFSKVAKALLALNDEYDLNPLSPPREKCKKFPRIVEKCNKHNFWLFAQSGRLNVDHLRKALERV